MQIDWNRYRVRLDAVGRTRWTRGLAVEPTWGADTRVTDHDLWFIWTGAGRMRLPSGWTTLRPGVCLWLRPGWDYLTTQEPQNPLGMNFVHFDLVDARGRRRPWTAPLPPEYLEPHDVQLAEAITRRVIERCFGFADREMSRPPYGPDTAATGAGLLMGLLMELDAGSDPHQRFPESRVSPRHDRLVRQVALRLTANPQEPVVIGRLAQEYGYSPDHFSKLFKRVTGQTPELYAVQARLRRAERLLRDTTLTVGEVATAVGYRDIYFFSKQFKQFHGLGPRAYRQRSATGRDL